MGTKRDIKGVPIICGTLVIMASILYQEAMVDKEVLVDPTLPAIAGFGPQSRG